MDKSTVFPRARGVWPALAAACLWGTAAVAAKQLFAVSQIDGLTIGFFRLALGFPALAGVFLGLSHVTFYLAIARVGVGVSALIVAASVPVASALLGRVFLREQLSFGLIASLLLAVGGGILLLGPDSLSGLKADRAAGVALAALASFLLGLVTIINRLLSSGDRPLLSASVACGAASVFLLPLMLGGPKTVITAQGWALLIYMGLATTALAYGLYFTALKHLPSSRAGVLSLGEPLTAVALAIVFFGENLGFYGWLGGAVIILAFINLYRIQAREEPVVG